ncbi:MAG: hypothetical protein ACRDJW_22085 [Thermomicrobiales bacterium]
MEPAIPNSDVEVEHDSLVPEIIYVSPEEGRQMFDDAAREWVGMSGEEFIRRWETGEFETIPDDLAHRRYVDLVLMIPFARQNG